MKGLEHFQKSKVKFSPPRGAPLKNSMALTDCILSARRKEGETGTYGLIWRLRFFKCILWTCISSGPGKPNQRKVSS